jgi:hypothetical protein
MTSSQADLADELQTAAACIVLELMHSWDVPPLADRALCSGLYSPSLAELAMTSTPIMSDVATLLQRAIGELGGRWPSRADAACVAARSCMKRIALEVECPRPALQLLFQISYAARDVAPDAGYCGQGLDLGSLIGIYYSYDEPGQGSKEDLDREARAEAQKWLERHPN